VATWLPRLRGPLDLRWDAGTYYVLGTSLAQGQGYRLLSEPGSIEAIQYPPLLPLIVAAHQWVLGTSDPITVGGWLRISFALLSLTFLLTSFILLEKFLPIGYAVLAAISCHLGLSWMFLSDVLFPELPFGLVVVLFVLCHHARPSPIYTVLAGACAIGAYLLRTAGLALFIAWIGYSLARKEFGQAALRATVALIPILLWNSYIAHVQASPAYSLPAYPYQRADYLFYNVSYSSNLSLREPLDPTRGKASPRDLLARFVRNSINVPRLLGEAVSADRGYWKFLVIDRLMGSHAVIADWVTDTILFLFGVLLLAGVAIQLCQREWLVSLLILTYCAIVCVTPWPEQWQRYWAPLTPLLLLALLKALLVLRDRGRARLTSPASAIIRALPAVVLGMILMVSSLTLRHAYTVLRGEVVHRDRHGQPVRFTLFFYGQAYRDFDGALEWLRTRARPTDVAAVAMPHWAYLLTGMKTVMPPFESDSARAQALLDAVPVRYVVIDRTSVNVSPVMHRWILPVLLAAPMRWAPVYSSRSGSATVYARVPETNVETGR
jgi:hypothetical protein